MKSRVIAKLRKTEAHLGGSLMAIDKKFRGNLHYMCRWVDELARTPACLLRGRDEHGHFDLQLRPQVDFGEIEMQRHDTTFKAYIESFYEQLGEAEKDLPTEAAAGMIY